MSDELLPYYNRELAFIRNLGAKFAQAYPKIAGRLRLGPETTEDPHVARMIESFAYLNARIRHKLDDDFPELTDALLGVIYPHYQRPIPSMSVVEFVLDPEQGELTSGYKIPRDVSLETEGVHGEPCRFQACYPVTLWPLTIRAANLVRPPFVAPKTPFASNAKAMLRIVLESTAKDLKLSQLSLESLRFFIKGQDQHVFPCTSCYSIMSSAWQSREPQDDPKAVQLDSRVLRPVGFERDEGMLPYPSRSFLGYRLLTEFFTFPQKFLFVDVGPLPLANMEGLSNRIEIYLFLNRASPELESQVSADTFRLGCTPIINLFKQRAEPIQLTQTKTEYRVVPDARRPYASQVYSIDRVVATSPTGEEVEYKPFFSFRHAAGAEEQRNFWHASPRLSLGEGPVKGSAQEIYLSLVDLNFDPRVPAEWTLDVETTCLNGDIPNLLPFGGGQPKLRLLHGGPITQVLCHVHPTAVLRPALKRGAMWRLVSHLSLNHLSISDGEGGADALREILKLYDFANSPETRSMTEGIVGVRSRRVIGALSGTGAGPICRGIEVTVQLDETRFAGSGLFLFVSVLERFLGLYCTINSFTKLIATTKQNGELRRWPPRAGEKVLL
ncbi:MAG: type VI secretion system baseplate subunit TssF [Planctomycetota bacterium]